MFAVTAITGKVGGAVARHLLAAGKKVRAVVRDEAIGAPWAALGCDVAVADVSDAGPLAAAFSGADGVFILLPPLFDPEPGFPEVKTAIGVIREALVRTAPPRVVVLSTIGADADRPNLLNALRFSNRRSPICRCRSLSCALHGSWRMPNGTSARRASRG
jgi:uncharacterized protein YbjT (DUF2867 family)